jgi:nucleoside-diphosphate-sugar epimerase
MKIVGRGMIARALEVYQNQFDDVVIFASGIADSTTNDPLEFEREYRLLYETIRTCLLQKKRLVYFSSGGAIYGQTNAPRSEHTPLFPTTAYGRHKLLCEALIQQSTLAYLIVRLPNLVGARQNNGQLIPMLVHQALRGKATIFEHATRDLVDVEDFASILMRLLDVVKTSETIIIASGYSLSVTEIFDEIEAVLKTKAHIEYAAKGDKQLFNVEKLRQLLHNDLVFHPNYFKDVIQKYAAQIAKSLP